MQIKLSKNCTIIINCILTAVFLCCLTWKHMAAVSDTLCCSTLRLFLTRVTLVGITLPSQDHPDVPHVLNRWCSSRGVGDISWEAASASSLSFNIYWKPLVVKKALDLAAPSGELLLHHQRQVRGRRLGDETLQRGEWAEREELQTTRKHLTPGIHSLRFSFPSSHKCLSIILVAIA